MTKQKLTKMGGVIFLLFAFSLNALSQNITIRGNITETNGDPLIGVTVAVAGTSTGTVTDIDGDYTLNNVPANAILEVSFVGMTTQRIAVNGRTTINVVMQEDSELLDELVVVGYGVQRRRDLTGAISTVRMDDAPVGTLSTVSHALAGTAAGLRVTQSTAQPGAGATFRIRGATSINAGNDPLIVIDGFPVSQSARPGGAAGVLQNDAGHQDNMLEMLNPNDIESIEILKDASATAIYGARAGNGVILITTRRGREGRTSVSYSGNAAVSTQSKRYDMMNAQEYMTLSNAWALERWRRDNGQGIYADYRVPNANPNPFNPLFTEAEIAGAQTTNWMDLIMRTGFQQSHNISVSGGSATSRHLVSLNYFDQQGILRNSAANRMTMNINSDYDLSSWVKAGYSVNLSRNRFDNIPIGTHQNEGAGLISAAARFEPYLPVRDENGRYTTSRVYVLNPNPVSLLDVVDKTNRDRVLANAFVQIEPMKNLSLRTNVGFDRRAVKRQAYYPSTVVGQVMSRNGVGHQVQDDAMDLLMNFTANYIKAVGAHNFTGLLGYEFQRLQSEWFRAGAQNFPLDGFLYNNLGAGSGDRDVASAASQREMASVFGRLNYAYADKYLLTATLRADGASNFTPAHRWGFFPSLALGWRFIEEDFMERTRNVLSNGRLRAGYGQTGNSNIGNRTLNYFGPGDNPIRYVFGNTGTVGMQLTTLGNSAITWETTSEWNVGLELGFLNNRIGLTAEYYDRIVSNLLVTNKRLASYSEITTMAANIGKTRGRGFELTLNTMNVRTRDFTWSSDFTFFTYKDRWEERDPDWIARPFESVNDPIRAIFGYRSDGLLQPGEKAPAWQPNLLPGQIKLQKLDETTTALGQTDMVLLGSQDPKFSYGINNTLRYKRFDVNIFMFGEVGRLRGPGYWDDWIPYNYSAPANAGIYNGGRNALNSWTMDNQGGSVPSILSPQNTGGHGDFFLSKIWFLRCRNITVGYNIPVSSKIANSLRVSATVNNPFVFTNYKGLDPETDYDERRGALDSNANLGNFSYPNVRTFNFGVDIRF